MDDFLPAREGKPVIEICAKHLNAIHAARSAFSQAEISEQIVRALQVS